MHRETEHIVCAPYPERREREAGREGGRKTVHGFSSVFLSNGVTYVLFSFSANLVQSPSYQMPPSDRRHMSMSVPHLIYATPGWTAH